MTKKQQTKLKRQFSYLKRQFKEDGVDLSKLKFEDLEQKTFSSLSSMRAKMIEQSGILEGLSVTSRKGQVFVKNENMKLAELLDLKRLSDIEYIESLYGTKDVKDTFYSYREVYDNEGVRVVDYNTSAFYDLYNEIWGDTESGYWLSYLVKMAKEEGDGSSYAQFLTEDLRISDYKFYKFKSTNYSTKK